MCTHHVVQGNRCCEEPGYRLAMIHTLPSLVVLDLHYVTPSERRQAAQLAGPGAAASALAFLQKAPARDPRAARVGKYSTLEQELQQVRQSLQACRRECQEGAGEHRVDTRAGPTPPITTQHIVHACTLCPLPPFPHTQTVAASHASQQHQQPGCTHGNAAGGGEQSSGASGWTARTSQLQPAHGTHAAATAPLCSGQQSHYMPKDTLVLHTHAGAGASTALQQRPGATTAAQRSGFCGSTFSQRLADSSWQLSKRTIKL